MKKIFNTSIQILFAVNVIFFFIALLIKDNYLYLISAITFSLQFFISLISLIISAFNKQYFKLFNLYSILFASFVTVLSIIMYLNKNSLILEIICTIFAVPSFLLGFYFEHEDEIKKRVEERKNKLSQ